MAQRRIGDPSPRTKVRPFGAMRRKPVSPASFSLRDRRSNAALAAKGSFGWVNSHVPGPLKSCPRADACAARRTIKEQAMRRGRETEVGLRLMVWASWGEHGEEDC